MASSNLFQCIGHGCLLHLPVVQEGWAQTVAKGIFEKSDNHINEICQQIEANSITNSIKDLYQGVKNLTRKFRPRIDVIKDENSKMLSESREVKDRWKTYCKKLYIRKNNLPTNSIISHSTSDNEEPPPSYSEIEKAIHDIKNGKSPGHDDVVAESVKFGDENVKAFFYKLCVAIWEQREWPEDWTTSIFIPIPKKGYTLECHNNRTIALISHCSKILLKIIAGRMKCKLQTEIAEEQFGFRPGRGTRDQILNLKMIIEKNREQRKHLYLCFIDYRKAFDTVVHEILWNVMKQFRFPPHIIDLIKKLYEQQKATVRASYGLTDWFRIGQGVRQGCILSPHLLNIYAERVMREALDNFEGTIRIGGHRVTNLRYADDVVLIAGTMHELQELVNRVVMESEAVGLFLNVSKTKLMKIKTDQPSLENLVINGEVVEIVDNFNYLGAIITNTQDDSKEIRKRISIAKNAVVSLTNVWKDTSISLKTKKRFLYSLIFPIATYGTECWTMKE